MAVIVDQNGMYIPGSDIPDFRESQEKELQLEPGQTLVVTPVPEGFYHPKWDGKVWTEGLSAKEIEQTNTPKTPENFPTVD